MSPLCNNRKRRNWTFLIQYSVPVFHTSQAQYHTTYHALCRFRNRGNHQNTSSKKLDTTGNSEETPVEPPRNAPNDQKIQEKENKPGENTEAKMETIIYCNIEGLIPRRKRYKIKMLEEIGAEYNCALICITESHLRNEIRDAEIKMKGYEMYRADRANDRKKGGVVINTRDNIAKDTQMLTNGSNGEIEHVILYINKWKILLCCMYRPPRCSTENMLEVLRIIEHEARKLGAPEPTIIINGDFNFPDIQWNDTTIYGGTAEDRLQANSLFTMMESLMLKQIIHIPTRGNNILDLFLTNDEDLISDVRAEDIDISDHRLMVVETTLNTKKQTQNDTANTDGFQSMNFFHDSIDWKAINDGISNIDWQGEMNGLTASEMYELFTSKLLNICIPHVPGKRPLKSHSIPRDRKVLMRKRTKLIKRLPEAENRNTIKQKLERIEMELAQSYEREAQQEEQRAISNIKANPKYFFKYAKKKANTRSTIGPLKYNGHLTSDPQKMLVT